MNRRDSLFSVFALGTLSAPSAGRAQQKKRIYRIGYLSTPTRESVQHVLDSFLGALRELGWVEGRNLSIEYRWADGHVDRLPGLAAELVRLKVDLIVAPATSAALAAKSATRTIPIVMQFPNAPVEVGLVASLRNPGGNITGTTFTAGPGIFGKQLQLLGEAVPGASRVALLSNASDSNPLQIKELESAAQALRIHLQRLEARGPHDFDGAFAAMARERAEALLVGGSSSLLTYRTDLAERALRARLPTMFNFRDMVEAGGLMAYGINMTDFIAHSAVYVDKILKGARPADLPVEQPTQFELVINLKTAKALGLAIPPSLLARASQVIE